MKKNLRLVKKLKGDESNSTSDKSSLDINKAHDIAEKAKQQNWLSEGVSDE